MRITDTRTQEKQEVAPSGGELLVYVCGVTPYAESHIGHAMSYIVFDVLRRFLEYRGYRVRHVQNFTDIDDKLIDRANQRGTTVEALAEKYIEEYFRDMDELNIMRATVYPRATQEIPQIIEIVQGLIDKGYAYAAGGDVFYRVRKKDDYGALKHQSLDDLVAGARVDVDELKEFPGDFALWKGARPGEPAWESPWGAGRPGWHIECSAMSMQLLGETLDIHGGGLDLQFPHHENELAQSESYTGKPFVRYWMHNGLMKIAGEKISKTHEEEQRKKAPLVVNDVLEQFPAETLRFFLLN